MTITKKELELEINALKDFGLTSEEIEGYLEFYKDTFIIEEIKNKKVRVINSKKRMEQ